MPIPDEAFRHCPGLLGRVKPPEDSFFRDMHLRYREFDARAVEEGREPMQRLSEEEREATRREALAGREGADLWVFAYGSLIWDPAVHVAELRRAAADGHARRFCMHLDGGRGSPERPGLMCSLDTREGRVCEGVALRIPAELVEAETRTLWMREMIAGAYRPDFVALETPQGPLEALAFLARHEHERYIDLPRPEQARRIAHAEGLLGRNIDYLSNMVEHLEAVGVHDPDMSELLELCLAERAGAE